MLRHVSFPNNTSHLVVTVVMFLNYLYFPVKTATHTHTKWFITVRDRGAFVASNDDNVTEG